MEVSWSLEHSAAGTVSISALLCMLVRLSVQPLSHSFRLGLVLLSPASPPAG